MACGALGTGDDWEFARDQSKRALASCCSGGMPLSIAWRRAVAQSLSRITVSRLSALVASATALPDRQDRLYLYSPKDGQPCLNHDRGQGEGINAQEYTAVKLKVLKWSEAAMKAISHIPDGSNVYFVAATLRLCTGKLAASLAQRSSMKSRRNRQSLTSFQISIRPSTGPSSLHLSSKA